MSLLNERVNLILELNISIPSRGKKDNKIYEVEFFLPVWVIVLAVDLDTQQQFNYTQREDVEI